MCVLVDNPIFLFVFAGTLWLFSRVIDKIIASLSEKHDRELFEIIEKNKRYDSRLMENEDSDQLFGVLKYVTGKNFSSYLFLDYFILIYYILLIVFAPAFIIYLLISC